jgi:drug/metabolite transporter (DMT)-like permease
MLFQSLFVCVLIVNVCFTVVDLMIRKTSLNVNSVKYIAQRSTLTVFFTLLWMLLDNGFEQTLTLHSSIQIIGCAILCGIGLFSFVEATKKLAFTNLLVIQAVGPILQQFIGKWLFNESVNLTLYISFAIALIGVLIQSQIPKNSKGVWLALLSILSWTLGYSLMSIPLKNTAMIWSVLFVEGTILTIAISVLAFRKNIADLFHSKIPKPVILIAMITVIGSYMLNYIYKHFEITNIAWFNLIFLPTTVLASQFIFKEKINKKEIISNLIILIAFVFHHLYS